MPAAGIRGGIDSVQSSQTPIVDPQSGIPTPEFYRWMLGLSNSGRPSFSVSMDGVDAFIPHAIYTKIPFTFKEWDTNGVFDNTSLYRLTPTVQGIYLIMLGVAYFTLGDGGVAVASIHRNGASYKAALPGASGSPVYSGGAFVSSFVPMNGTTDYIEFFTSQFTALGGDRTLVGTPNATHAAGMWLSPFNANSGNTDGLGWDVISSPDFIP